MPEFPAANREYTRLAERKSPSASQRDAASACRGSSGMRPRAGAGRARRRVRLGRVLESGGFPLKKHIRSGTGTRGLSGISSNVSNLRRSAHDQEIGK